MHCTTLRKGFWSSRSRSFECSNRLAPCRRSRSRATRRSGPCATASTRCVCLSDSEKYRRHPHQLAIDMIAVVLAQQIWVLSHFVATITCEGEDDKTQGGVVPRSSLGGPEKLWLRPRQRLVTASLASNINSSSMVHRAKAFEMHASHDHAISSGRQYLLAVHGLDET